MNNKISKGLEHIASSAPILVSALALATFVALSNPKPTYECTISGAKYAMFKDSKSTIIKRESMLSPATMIDLHNDGVFDIYRTVQGENRLPISLRGEEIPFDIQTEFNKVIDGYNQQIKGAE
jgi:hypothetical protein